MHRKRTARYYIFHLSFVALAAGFLALIMLFPWQPASASVRPYWNGRSPAVWTSPVDPMCLAKFSGRHGWVKAGSHRFRAVCRAGSWDII
jgi:hypothetical protein